MFTLKAVFAVYLLSQVVSGDTTGDDFGLDIYKFLKKHHYPVETHWINTEDGYILRMQRISRRNGTLNEKQHKPAVLLMHGLLSSAMDFVNRGPNKSLALVLADAGYDVWLGNNRGNTWSRNHVSLDPDYKEDKPKFWDFSFEKCGYYDLPAKIDHIIEKTGQPKIFYLGHSQGTTEFFAMAALRPQYNDKIALMTALAPVGYMKHLSSPIARLMAKNMSLLKNILTSLGVYEVLGKSWIFREIAKVACSENSKTIKVCEAIIFSICGFDPAQFDTSLLPILVSNAPAGISINMLLHYGQEITSGEFRRYDYGSLLNIKKYNSPSPPAFNISAITAPVALYYAQNDLLSAVQDVEKLADQLPNVVKQRLIEHKLFNHLDFIVAKDVNAIINVDVLEHMQGYINDTIPIPDPPTTTPPSGNQGNLNYVMNTILILVVTIGIRFL